MKKLIIISILTPSLIGCLAMDKLFDNPTGDAIPTSDQASEVSSDGEKTGEMTIKPEVRSAINFAGDVAPFPWAGLAASGLLNVLTAYGSLRGRKWKKAASSSIAAGNQFRKVLKEAKPDQYREIKERIIGDQNADGTRPLIKTILNKLT